MLVRTFSGLLGYDFKYFIFILQREKKTEMKEHDLKREWYSSS